MGIPDHYHMAVALDPAPNVVAQANAVSTVVFFICLHLIGIFFAQLASVARCDIQHGLGFGVKVKHL